MQFSIVVFRIFQIPCIFEVDKQSKTQIWNKSYYFAESQHKSKTMNDKSQT